MPKATKKQTGDKKEKKVKDPNAPKRPISAYFAFAADKREQIKKENPGFKVTDISKRTGELWKDLTEAEKKPYNEKAEKDKARYQKEMDAYNGGGGAKKKAAPKKKAAAESDAEDEEEEEEDDE